MKRFLAIAALVLSSCGVAVYPEPYAGTMPPCACPCARGCWHTTWDQVDGCRYYCAPEGNDGGELMLDGGN